MSTLAERLNRFEAELRRMDAELRELRHEVPAEEPAAEPRPAAAPTVSAPRPTPPPARPATPSSPARPARPHPRRPRVDVGGLVARLDLFGAGGLAVVGGAVTALGITLLFVLAAEQGWIGPVARVLAGAVTASLVFGAGVVVRHRFGQVKAGLAAVAAGIAGGYATLAAATALYGLVPDALALALAAGIAGIAVAVSLLWRSELVAVLGLVGAALAPALEGLEGGIVPAGLAFAVVVLAATAVVSVVRRWDVLLASVTVVVGAQAVWLLALEGRDGVAASLAAAGALAAVLLAAACAWQLGGRTRVLQQLTTPLVLASLGTILVSSHVLLSDGVQRGVALAVATAVLALVWAAVRERQGDLAVVLAGGALGVAAVAVAGLLSDDGLTLSWAAEAALLVVLAHRLRDLRLQLAGLAYLGLAAGHLLLVGRPLVELFDLDGGHAATAVPTAAVAVAALAAALLAPETYRSTGERGILAFLEDLRVWLEPRRPRLVEALAGGAALLGLVAFGLVAVALDANAGQVAVTLVAAQLAVLGTVVAARRDAVALGAVAYGGAFVVGWKALELDLGSLPSGWGGAGALLAAGGLLATGALLRICWSTAAPLGVGAAIAAAAALALAFAGVADLAPETGSLLLPDRTWVGIGSALIAAVYLWLAALTYRPRLRNLSTTAWVLGLVPLLVAELALTDGGVGFAIALAATAIAAALLASRLVDPRLWCAAVILIGLDALLAVLELAPPQQLLEAGPSPATGVVAVLAVVAGLVTLALAGPYARWFAGAAAALGLYAASLLVLEVVVDLSRAALETDFERGHTVVSVVWAVSGLGLLLAGIVRRSPAVRYAGLGLFGVTLGKIFLFDLAELSSVARAISFVGVGALLLAGGFFVQRLGQREVAASP